LKTTLSFISDQVAFKAKFQFLSFLQKMRCLDATGEINAKFGGKSALILIADGSDLSALVRSSARSGGDPGDGPGWET
jgi:hypothetical protein